MYTKTIKPLSLFICVCLLFSIAPMDRVSGVGDLVINVNTTDDGRDFATNSVCSVGHQTTGPCTLRAAISEANGNAPYQNVIINIPAGTYLLTIPPDAINDIHSGDLNIGSGSSSNSITINGISPGTVVIDANHLDRVLFNESSGLVTINNVVIRGGYLEVTENDINGAGIFNYGNLALNRVVIEDNMLEYKGEGYCPYWAYGGGIFSGGILSMVDSTIQRNVSPYASALYKAGGTATIDHSTINENYASASNTIINFASIQIINSTIAGNTSNGSAGIQNYGTLTIMSSTISNSGIAASIEHRGASVTVSDSIFNAVPRQAGSSYNCFFENDSLSLISFGHNIFSDDTCKATGTNDLTETDPLLGELGWWGGPTKTVFLLEGSPAIDHRDGECFSLVAPIANDQRYYPRNDGHCDTGAFEGSLTLKNAYLPLILR